MKIGWWCMILYFGNEHWIQLSYARFFMLLILGVFDWYIWHISGVHSLFWIGECTVEIWCLMTHSRAKSYNFFFLHFFNTCWNKCFIILFIHKRKLVKLFIFKSQPSKSDTFSLFYVMEEWTVLSILSSTVHTHLWKTAQRRYCASLH